MRVRFCDQNRQNRGQCAPSGDGADFLGLPVLAELARRDERVSLRRSSGSEEAAPLPAQPLELLLARAKDLGVPLHHDAQIAALPAVLRLRLRDDIPVQLYAAAASVLASIYDAAEE